MQTKYHEYDMEKSKRGKGTSRVGGTPQIELPIHPYQPRRFQRTGKQPFCTLYHTFSYYIICYFEYDKNVYKLHAFPPNAFLILAKKLQLNILADKNKVNTNTVNL